MRNPNGYGSVIKRKKNLRNPYLARVTVGWKEVVRPDGTMNVVQQFLNIGSFPTKSAALRALAEYNKNPKTVKKYDTTYGDLYPLWLEKRRAKVKEQSLKNYISVYENYGDLFSDIRLVETTIGEVEDIFADADLPKTAARMLLLLLRQIYDYALHAEMITGENPLLKVELPDKAARESTKHTRFTDDEIQILWNNQGQIGVDITLFLIYTGLRGAELANLRKADVHLPESYFDVVESKTKSGIRKVPIADKIKPILERFMRSSETKFVLGEYAGVRKIQSEVKNATEGLHIPHITHDTRYTLVSLLANKGVDERYIQSIVGHKSRIVTRNVYQELDIKVLIDAVNQI